MMFLICSFLMDWVTPGWTRVGMERMATETASAAETLPVQVGFAWDLGKGAADKAAKANGDSGNRRVSSRVWKAGTRYAKERAMMMAPGSASLDKSALDKSALHKRAQQKRAEPQRVQHPSPDVLAMVARADVSPEVRDALASFGQALAAGHVARKRPTASRRPWWDRD